MNKRYLFYVKLEHDQATDHNGSEIEKKHVDFEKHESLSYFVR